MNRGNKRAPDGVSTARAITVARPIAKTSLEDKVNNLLASLPESFYFVALCYVIALMLSFSGAVTREDKARAVFRSPQIVSEITSNAKSLSTLPLPGSFKN
jgi:hypothetical protein